MKKRLKDFTSRHLVDRDLIIKMLKYEDSIILSPVGIEIRKLYPDGLDSDIIINKITLNNFDFKRDHKSLQNYRKIFRTYYKSPSEYDKEVMDSVAYMRENKCVFYKLPEPQIGEVLPNCDIYKLNDSFEKISSATSIYDEIKNIYKYGDNPKHIFVSGFSNS